MNTNALPYTLPPRRKAMGLTVKEAAEKIHIPYRTYEAWEYGTREPHATEINALAELYDCTTDDLLRLK